MITKKEKISIEKAKVIDNVAKCDRCGENINNKIAEYSKKFYNYKLCLECQRLAKAYYEKNIK